MNTVKNPIQQPQETPPPREPITCPICGKREIAFVTEYHKSIGCRIISIIAGILFLCLFAPSFGGLLNGTESDLSITLEEPIASIFAIIFVVTKIAQYFIEAKTHVQAICKDCGHLWLLN